MDTMKLDVIERVEEFNSMGKEWNDLLTCCSASHVPFLRHEYVTAWWSTLGGGEWTNGELFTIVARNEQGELAGIAPLFLTNNQEGERALMFIGSIEISDYLDLIVPSDKTPDFVEAFLDLAVEDSGDWQVLDLYNILEDSPTLTALQAAAKQRGLIFTRELLQPCPYIPLPGDWEVYLASIDKKQRHEIRRKIRRLEEAPEDIHFYILNNRSDLDAEIDDFLTLMAQDPEKEKFLSNEMRQQICLSAQKAFDSGWLQLAFLSINGEKAAGYMNFDFADHIWVYNSGMDFKFREYSPGWVLLGYLLKWANDNKRIAFDFMRGGEEYKYRFGGVNRYVTRVKIYRKSS